MEYGPCIGISRRDRMLRAQKNGIALPDYLMGLLDSKAKGVQQECLWANITERVLTSEGRKPPG